MRILGLIPARGGSKGVPRKNIKLLHGKPLVQYSIESALKCELIDKLVVSTDDEEIANISRDAGADVPFLRPNELATDGSPSIDLVVHALRYLEKKGDYYDAVCLLQPTVPYRSGNDLHLAIMKYKTNAIDSLVSVREVPHVYNPYWTFQENPENGTIHKVLDLPELVNRRQDLPKVYHRDGSVYITSTKTILEEHSLYGKSTGYCIMSASPDINIDTLQDWEKAEQIDYKGDGFSDPLRSDQT